MLADCGDHGCGSSARLCACISNSSPLCSGPQAQSPGWRTQSAPQPCAAPLTVAPCVCAAGIQNVWLVLSPRGMKNGGGSRGAAGSLAGSEAEGDTEAGTPLPTVTTPSSQGRQSHPLRPPTTLCATLECPHQTHTWPVHAALACWSAPSQPCSRSHASVAPACRRRLPVRLATAFLNFFLPLTGEASVSDFVDMSTVGKKRGRIARCSAQWLDVKSFATTAACVAALRADGREIWATDLSQVRAPAATNHAGEKH
jgi:hypothetical protein